MTMTQDPPYPAQPQANTHRFPAMIAAAARDHLARHPVPPGNAAAPRPVDLPVHNQQIDATADEMSVLEGALGNGMMPKPEPASVLDVAYARDDIDVSPVDPDDSTSDERHASIRTDNEPAGLSVTAIHSDNSQPRDLHRRESGAEVTSLNLGSAARQEKQ